MVSEVNRSRRVIDITPDDGMTNITMASNFSQMESNRHDGSAEFDLQAMQ